MIKLMGRLMAITALGYSGTALAQAAPSTSGAVSVDALIKLLVDRGTITRAEADTLVAAARTQPQASTSGEMRQASDVQIAKATPSTPQQEAPGTPRPSTAAPEGPSQSMLVKADTKDALTVDWSEGAPQFVSPGGFTFRPRSRILVDFQSTGGSNFPDRNIATTGARALRLGVEGTYGTNLFYQFEADFADAGTEVTSAYFGWRKKVAPSITTEINVGSRLTERGIEGSTGSDQTPFLERDSVGVGLVPLKGFFGLGLTSKTFGPNWHVTTVIVGEAINGSSSDNDSWTGMGRAHWNPVKSESGVIHLGAWGYLEAFSTSVANLTLNVREANRYNDNIRVFTGPLGAPDHANAFGLEAGATHNGLWSFGEYGQRRITFRDPLVAPRVDLKAWSVSAGMVLTGEKAPFAPRGATFTTLAVDDPVFNGGWGAFEVLARYEETDYSDAPLGGRGHAWTAGLNWYLNDLTRVMVNYIHFDTANRAGDFVGQDNGDTLATRLQISF